MRGISEPWNWSIFLDILVEILFLRLCLHVPSMSPFFVPFKNGFCSSSGSRGGGRGGHAPPDPVKIGHKKDGHRRRPHRFHVSRPPSPYPAAGSATVFSPMVLFTRNVKISNVPLTKTVTLAACVMLCSHLTSAFASTSMSPSKFNIASLFTQTQRQRWGLNPFSTSTFALLLIQC